MTGNSGTRTKVRAAFLAFVMVMSVFGGTLAFSGSSAAQTSATAVTAQQVSTSDAEVASLSEVSPSAQTIDSSTTSSGTAAIDGGSINSQGSDSSVFDDGNGLGSDITVDGETVTPQDTGDPSLFGTVTLDANGDGTAEEVVYQLSFDSTAPSTNVFIDQNDNNDLSDDGGSVAPIDGNSNPTAVTFNGINVDLNVNAPEAAPDSNDIDDGTDDLTLTATPNTGTASINAQTVDDNSAESVDFEIIDSDSDAVPDVVDLDVDQTSSIDYDGLADGDSVTFSSGLSFDVGIAASPGGGTEDLSLTANTGSIAVRTGSFDATEGPFTVYFTDEDSNGVADTGPYVDFDGDQNLESGEGPFAANDDVTDSALNEKYRVSGVSAQDSTTIRPVLRAGVTYDIRVLELGSDGQTAYLDDITSDLVSPADGATSGSDSSVYAQGDDFYSATFNSDGNATFTGITVDFAGTALDDGTGFSSTADDDSVDESSGLDSYIGVNDGSGDGTEVLTLEVEPSSQLTNVETTLDSTEYNEEQSFTVTVTDTDGNTVSNADVEVIQDASPDDNVDHTSTLASGFTGSNGEYTATIQPSAAGEIRVRVTDDIGGQLGTPENTDGIDDVEDISTTTVDPITLGVNPQQPTLTNGFNADPDFDITLNGEAFGDGQGTGAAVRLRGEPLDEDDSFVGDETQYNLYGTDDGTNNGGSADGTLNSDDSFSNEETFAPDATGTIDVAADFQEDGSGDVGPAEYNGTTTLDVVEGDALNVQTDTQSAVLDSGDDGTRDTFSPVLTIQDGNAEGLKNAGDGALESNDFEEVSITITSSNGEFTLDSAVGGLTGGLDAAGAGDNGEPAFNNTDNDLTVTGVTVENGDLDTGTSSFQIEGLTAEQNTTLTFDVTATTSAGDTFTRTVTTDVSDTDIVSDVSLSGEVESGQTADISLQVADGTGTPVNNRVVIIKNQAGIGSGDDLFNVSETANANVDAIVINPIDGQIEFDTDGNINDQPEQTRPFNIQNGQYVVENVTIASAGVDHVIEVHKYDSTNLNDGELRAQLDNQISSVGVAAYNISSDVDPVLVGQDEQINLTVSENGQRVNGSTLTELAGNTDIDQQGNDVDTVVAPSAVDTDGDNTVDTIQATVNADESGTAAVNVTTALTDNSKRGTTSIDVVQPQITTNLTGDLTLGLQSTNVEIVAEDPRNGNPLAGDTLRFTATNTSFVMGPDADFAGNGDIADGGTDTVTLDSNGTAVIDIAPEEQNAGTQPITLDLAVQNDSASFFGDTSIGVGTLTLADAPDSLDPSTDFTQTYELVDANGNSVDLATLEMSGSGLSGNAITQTTDEGFVNFDFTTSSSGTIDVVVQNTNDLAVFSNNNEFTVKTINVLQPVNLSLSADQTEIAQNDSVDFTLVREDFDQQTAGTLTVTNASGSVVNTVSTDGTATVTFDEAGEFTVTASKATRPQVGKSFVNDTVDVTVTEPDSVQLDNVNLDPSTVETNTTNDHTLTFDALTVSDDGNTDTFTVTIPGAATLDSANNVTVTDANGSDVSLSGGPDVSGNEITFSVAPDSSATTRDLSVETNVTVSVPDVSNETTADIQIDASDSDRGSDSANATLTIQPEAVEQPTASVTFDDETVENGSNTVTVDSANLSEGGFVVIHSTPVTSDNITAVDSVIGNSTYLEPGTSENITITLEQNITSNTTLVAMAHQDTNDNEEYDFVTSGGQADTPYTENGSAVTDSAEITVEQADDDDGDIVDRFDEDGDGIESPELLDAIDQFRGGDLTAPEILTLIENFRANN